MASGIEVAIKTSIGKLALNKNELRAVCSNASIRTYPVRSHHADRLFDLPLKHKDPFDRLIVSIALSDDLPVISCDEQLRKYKGLRVIW